MGVHEEVETENDSGGTLHYDFSMSSRTIQEFTRYEREGVTKHVVQEDGTCERRMGTEEVNRLRMNIRSVGEFGM